MEKVVTRIEKLIAFIGEYSSWLNTVLVIIIGIDVFLRKVFSTTEAWVLDLEWQIFAALFLLGMAYTLQADQHVRVDVFYTKYSEKKKAVINVIGTILFCLPWSVLLIIKSYHYAMNSWYIREGSANPGGLEALYIIKFIMLIGFILLFLQALALLYRSIQTLR